MPPTFVLVSGGGLGNLLCQHHMMYALARTRSTEIYASADLSNCHRPPMIAYATTLFQHVAFVDLRSCEVQGHYEEPTFTYQPIDKAVEKYEDGIVTIRGCFQSYKFFQGFEQEIRDLLRRNVPAVWAHASAKYAALKASHPSSRVVCVHIRRGDYHLLSTKHTVQSEKYYLQALHHLQPGSLLLVFAEDIGEIRHWDVWRYALSLNFRLHFVDEPEPLPTLFLMSLCDDFVIANSSLSLNAYYLREHTTSRCIAPQRWFGPDGPQFAMEDIVPPGSIIIDA
jgi:hypothetical protein